METKNACIDIGYYHPSNANWSYHIFMIIDATGARLYRSTFGGEHRTKAPLEFSHAGKGSSVEYKWRDIKDLLDIESYTGKNWPRNNS